LTMPGVPGIYFHSLTGSRNYYNGVEESGIKRRINREKLNIEDLANELADSGSLRYNIYTFYKQILSIRTKEKAFNPFGSAEYLDIDNDKIFIVRRHHNKETIYAIYNFSDKLVQMNSLVPNVCDLLSGKELTKNIWEIEPYCFCWYKIKIKV